MFEITVNFCSVFYYSCHSLQKNTLQNVRPTESGHVTVVRIKSFEIVTKSKHLDALMFINTISSPK